MGHIASVGSDSLNKMQFMPQNMKKTNAIHAVGIKSAANTVGGTSGKSQPRNLGSIILKADERSHMHNTAGNINGSKNKAEKRSKSRELIQ